MISELGHFLLISAFCLNLGLIANCISNKPVLVGYTGFFDKLESLLLTLLVISFSLLVISFITSDFSLKLVANNSHLLKPFLYKFAGAWGNHEGSMLLWVLILTLYLFLFQLSSRDYKCISKERNSCSIINNSSFFILSFGLFKPIWKTWYTAFKWPGS